MKKLLFLFLGVLLLATKLTHAQQNQPQQNFYVQARMIEGNAYAKIIPGNQAVWYLGLKHGYTVSVAFEEGNGFSPFQVITNKLMPAEKSKFTDSELPASYADAMQKMIYEADYTLSGGSFDDMLKTDEAMGRMYYSFILLSSYHPKLSEYSGLQFDLPQTPVGKYKVKVEINQYPSYNYEQLMLGSQVYTDAQSPELTLTPGDKSIILNWNHKEFRTLFVAYQIERSIDGIGFNSLGIPRVFNGQTKSGKLGMIQYVDSLPENYINYWYRVRGFDAFGYLSKPGEPIKIQSTDLTPPSAPKRVTVKQVTPQTVNLTWQQLPTNDLEGFQVIGSTSAEGEYKRLHEKLLAPTERMFQFDISGELLQYYRILAVDTAKNAAASDLAYLVTVDTIPPVVPTDMKIEIDTNRVVTLSWSASSSKDIKGYRLMKAYHPSNGFSPITAIPITGLSYTDTIPRQRVDRNVYYQLVALDQNFNHSDPADFVAAIIPDDIPPTSPLLSKVEILDDKAVEISWKASSSRDVASYKVYRIFDEDTTTTEFLINETNATSYIDREFDNNHIQFATYAVACVDSSGNISERSNARRIFSKKNAHLKALKISNIVQVESKVQIEWATKAAAKQVILIYRKQDDKRFELLARAKDEGSYIDKKVKAGSSYQYKIGILEESGKKSPLSESVSVKVK